MYIIIKMKTKNISIILGAVLALFLSLMLANAVQSFTVSPSTVTDTTALGVSDSTDITITNTGNESIDIAVTKSNLALNSNSVTITLNDTALTLASGASAKVKASYTPSGVPSGSYAGSVTVTNDDNSSQSSTVTFTVTVNSAGESVEVVGVDEGDSLTMSGDIDDKETKTFKLRNNGNVDLTNVRISVSDLDGQDGSDEIDSGDVDVNDDNFDLDIDDSERFEIEVDIPDDIEEDTYVGIVTITTGEGYEFEFELEVEVTGGNADLEISSSVLSVSGGVMKIIGEAGDTEDNYEFQIRNVGNLNVNDITFELDGDLEEEFSSATIDESFVTFSPSSIDLEDGDRDEIEVTVEIPSDAQSGTYFAEIRAVSSTGKVFDDIRLEVKVVGDVYIDSITYDNEVTPGDNLDVEVVVKNQGSSIVRSLKITGTLFDIDIGNSDITESSSTFLLESGSEKTEIIRFKIPAEASDGSHTLELRLDFGDDELVEVQEVIVSRPVHKINFESFGVNPGVIKCEGSLYTFAKVQNLGKFDEDVKFTTTIIGTGITKTSSTFELEVDENYQNNQVLDVSGIDAGTYKVEHKVSYNSNLFVKQESSLRVDECRDTSVGIDIDPIQPTNETNSTPNTYSLFGSDIPKTTVYLGGGIGAVFVLILVTLFFL